MSDDEQDPPRRPTHRITGARGQLVHGVPVVPESVVTDEVDDYDRTPVWDVPDRPVTERDLRRLQRSFARQLDERGKDGMSALEVAIVRDALDSMRRLRNWVLCGALAGVIALATFMFTRGLSEGGDKARLERLDKDVEKLWLRYGATSTPDATSSASK